MGRTLEAIQMKKIMNYLRLLRPQQWYKNLVVLLAYIFTPQINHLAVLNELTLGFISLCLISSTNYIINDIIDLKKDRQNPEKRSRPLASGDVSISEGLITSVLLLVIGLFIANILGNEFLITAIFLFGFTMIYTFILKKEAFADILSISINFVTRAIAGVFAINPNATFSIDTLNISPWLILCTFFLALFLAVGKRRGELMHLKSAAASHRSTLQSYTPELTNALLIITTALLLTSYSLYTFLSEHKNLIYTLPFALYAVFRYFSIIYSGSAIGRHPEKVFKDVRMIIAMLLWVIAVVLAVYLLPIPK